MKRTCSKRGQPGHYARTCGHQLAAAARRKTVNQRPARAATAAPPGPVDDLPGGSVIEQLEIRKQRIQDRLAGVERLQREIETVDRILQELRSIEGGA